MLSDIIICISAAIETLGELVDTYSQRPNIAMEGLVLAGIWIAGVMIRRSYITPLRKIPGPILNRFSNMPLIYNNVLGRYHTYVQRLHETYGDVVRIGYNKVSISSLAELKRILSTHEFRKGQMYEYNGLLVANSFSATDPEISKARRRQIGNSYSLASVRQYEDKILEHGILSLMAHWDLQLAERKGTDKKARVNYYYGFHGMAFDVIGILGFGRSFNVITTGDTTIIEQVYKTLKVGILQSSMPLGNYMHRLFRDMVKARYTLAMDTLQTIKKRKAENAAAQTKDISAAHSDVLQRLVDAHDPVTGEKMDDEAVKAEMSIMLVAGTDTTSNTLVWATLCLLHYPAVYARLKHEIRSAFPDRSTVIRYDAARTNVPYLTAFLYEVLRMYPAVSGHLPRRVPLEGACLANIYQVPHGTELCISIGACHRNPSVWTDPNTFDPERFMGPDAEDRIRNVMAFSSGVRNCIGRFLGLVELFTTMANLVHKYDFSMPDDIKGRYGSVEDVQASAYLTLAPRYPKNDCWVMISPR